MGSSERDELTDCRPQREHTEIEEELHEVAHIDYDRVSIVSGRGPMKPSDAHGARLPIHRWLPSTKMLWCTRLERPSRLPEL